MIDINKKEGQKILELGGGMNRHPASDVNLDCRAGPGVDIVCDLNKGPLPFLDASFDAVLCVYALEHCSYRRVPAILRETWRVLKPEGKAIFLVPNTEAQIEWIKTHPEGWDKESFFESASKVLMGSQDYSENSHRIYLSPSLVFDLFKDAGFQSIQVAAAGERQTDLSIVASKPDWVNPPIPIEPAQPIREAEPQPTVVEQESAISGIPTEQIFDRHYFTGGGRCGGYAREGMRDFACHETTARYVLVRKPESVLEIGCGRGYIMKRLQDAGVRCTGLEVSKHCNLTAAARGIIQHDILKTPWPLTFRKDGGEDHRWDLCLSVATLEHIPESALPAILGEMSRCTKRGLHGVDFGQKDDGFDKSHITLKPQKWWRALFDHYGLQSHEIVDKESLEAGNLPPEVLAGDGKIKLNCGCGMNMFHHGWTNVDLNKDLEQFSGPQGYRFLRRDLRRGIPYATGTVDLIFASLFLEHLSYREGETFLKECRRVLKPDGALRIVVPNAKALIDHYVYGGDYEYGTEPPRNRLFDFDEMDEACSNHSTPVGKLHALLCEGHASIYDYDLLAGMISEAKLKPEVRSFREGHSQILHETVESYQGGTSLFVDAVPVVG